MLNSGRTRNREGAFAERRVELAPALQHRQHLRGRGQPERQAEREDYGPGIGRGEPDDRTHREPADHDLRQPDPEDRSPQPPQPRRVQFEPYDEQQQDDADLGEPDELVGIPRESEHLRPDDRTRDEITQRRTQPEAPEQQHEEERRSD